MPLNRADVYTRAQESGRPRCRPTDCNSVFDGRLKACQQVGLFPNCHVINHTRCLVFCCRRSYGNNRKIESRSSNANATKRKRLSWLHFLSHALCIVAAATVSMLLAVSAIMQGRTGTSVFFPRPLLAHRLTRCQ